MSLVIKQYRFPTSVKISGIRNKKKNTRYYYGLCCAAFTFYFFLSCACSNLSVSLPFKSITKKKNNNLHKR